MIITAVTGGLYKGFRFDSSDIEVSHLQYADDTLLFGEPTYDNLWTMKSILRCFELASGLKINYHKSSLYGVHMQHSFLLQAATFLNCRVGDLPFIYLGYQ